ncbi:MAG: bacillithiol biosynthesis BshC, partial [Myxococcales bacterium]|nr:bacillithiol biosynthesis BshC [Myxococcales bacterium]
PEATWVEAFAQAFGAIFDDAGLLLLDPRQDAVAALAAEVQRRAIVDAAALEEAVQVGAAALEARGRVPLVTPRPGCSLGFYHPDGPEGSRYRLVRDGERWRCPGRDGVWTTAALVEELAREPRRFSTSSLLRVVVQDSLLPTAAQVAGPSEAQYLEQMPPLHEAFGLRSPDVVLRGRFVVTDTAARRRLADLGLDATAIGGGPEAILERLASEEPGPNGDEVAARLVEAMGRELDALTPDLQAIDASLAHAVERTRRHVARGAGSLGRRIDRARARRDGVRNERVAWLCRRLAPGGIPQERGLSFVALAARYGIATLREAVAARVEDHLAISNEGRAPGLLEVAL